jgi:hypothetical protein
VEAVEAVEEEEECDEVPLRFMHFLLSLELVGESSLGCFEGDLASNWRLLKFKGWFSVAAASILLLQFLQLSTTTVVVVFPIVPFSFSNGGFIPFLAACTELVGLIWVFLVPFWPSLC